MILTCKDCNTSFSFDERLINKSGSKVRCSNCQSVFVVYPPSPSDRPDTLSDTEAKPDDAISAAGGAAGLDDLDLDAIENSLDLDVDESQAAEATPVAESSDFDFDLDLEEDVASVAAPDVEFEETQELDLSDFDMDEKSKPEEAAVETADDLSFDLDLDADTADEAPARDEAGGEKSDDLDFDLDFDLDTDAGETALEEESAPIVEPAESATDDLDFSLDLDDDEAAAGAEDDLDFDLDLETEEGAEPAPDAAETETPVAEEADDLDFDLDLDLEPAAETEPVEAESDISDGLDFDLDLESEPAGISTTDAVPGLEETEELDLADLEDMIEVEEDTDMEGAADQAADDVDLDLEPVAEDEGEEEALSSELELEETEELDLTGLEDALELEEDTPAESFEETDEFDLDLDLGTDTGETAAAEPVAGLDGDEGEFDLSGLDDMLEIEEIADAEDSEAQEEDFALELDDVDGVAGAAADAADVELEFEAEDDEPDSGPAAAGSQGEEFAEAFDMGTLSDVEATVETGDGEDFFDAEEEAAGVGKKRKKAAKKGIGGFFKILLVLVFLVGGGYGAVTLAPFFGIDLMEQVKSIPYVGEFFGPKVDQAGNLRITVLEKRLEGFFLQNSKLGTLYVVKGRVKNNYDHPRSFISITGKVYSKGAKLRQTKTVYAGNILNRKQLTNLNQGAIEKRLNRRSGQKQSNLKVQTGKVIPFMIVFTRVPKNLDEYTVQVAGSVKAKK